MIGREQLATSHSKGVGTHSVPYMDSLTAQLDGVFLAFRSEDAEKKENIALGPLVRTVRGAAKQISAHFSRDLTTTRWRGLLVDLSPG